MIEIDKNIDLPAASRGAGIGGIYPWKELGVGDSFFVPAKDGVRTLQRNLSCGGRLYTRRHGGGGFATRVVTENGVKGVRVWRIADEPKLRAVK